MKKTKLLSLVTAVILCGSMIMTSCGGGTSSSSDGSSSSDTESSSSSSEAEGSSSEATGESAYPGTPNANEVTFNIGAEPPKMNSILTTDTTSFNILRHISEGLTSLDKEDNVIEGAAEKWEISDDKLTYTFHLRDGLTWNDGVPVTANDYKFAWMGLLNPENAAEYNYMGYYFENGEAYNNGKAKAEDVGIKVIDDKTIEVKLSAPAPYFLSLLAFGSFMPVREDSYSPEYATEASNIKCNGPYIMESWNHESDMVLVKNPNYWDAANISIEKITLMMIKDSNTALNSFKSNEIDIITLTGEQPAQLAAEGEKVDAYSDGSNWAFAYNLTRDATKNINVRKALTLAIDRERFIKDVLKNPSIPAYNWTPTTLKNGDNYFTADIKPTFKDNDIEGAKEAWAKAIEELGSTPKLSVLCDDSDNAKLQAAYYQECWKQVGIEVEIAAVPYKERLARQQAQDYDIAVYGWGPDFNDPLTYLDMWHSKGGNNIIKLNSAEYDKNVEAARIEPDFEKRTKMLQALEAELVENYYLGPIYNRMRDYIVSEKVDGFLRTAFQDWNFRWATATAAE